ncbi:type II toxin-antitoxin system HipA family toxin [Phenylobacterium sp.]|uniref:type II toxin-antitoxin system HipA family toxin n=1 Tax=Phenylobacterium sp. TaxID=1871053 RepID=UPI0030F49B7A
MARRPAHAPLAVYMNNRRVGRLLKQSSGAIEFRYEQSWLDQPGAIAVSLSLPLREDRYIGAPVAAVFENLLPDSPAIRNRVAERMGAAGVDAFSLLAKIGRDCVGAMQFMPEDEVPTDSTAIRGEPVNEADIAAILNNLERAPLGLNVEDEFRISVAGAQEKTALLMHQGQWCKPRGATATTHIFKPPIGRLHNGIDMTDSVENEYYCLTLMAAFGLETPTVGIGRFGDAKALVVERFDRRLTKDGRMLRLPQEDCCQALSVPPTLKYEDQGGPGVAAIAKLLKGSDTPNEDLLTLFKTQILFWLIGATDGHAKNFSLFLGPGGRYRLTPIYDVMTAQPAFDRKQITHRQFKLAMALGDRRHYGVLDIQPRHLEQTAAKAGVSAMVANRAMAEVREAADRAFDQVENQLPADFPSAIPVSVRKVVKARLGH